MGEIRPANDADFARFYGGRQLNARMVGRGLWRRRLLAGFGGAIETADGEWLAFLEVPEGERKPSIYRHILQCMDEVKAHGAKVVKAWCDPEIPRSDALMKRLGFSPTDEEIDGKVVWRWVL